MRQIPVNYILILCLVGFIGALQAQTPTRATDRKVLNQDKKTLSKKVPPVIGDDRNDPKIPGDSLVAGKDTLTNPVLRPGERQPITRDKPTDPVVPKDSDESSEEASPVNVAPEKEITLGAPVPDLTKEQKQFDEALRKAGTQDDLFKTVSFFEDASKLCSTHALEGCDAKLDKQLTSAFYKAQQEARSKKKKNEVFTDLATVARAFCQTSIDLDCRTLYRELQTGWSDLLADSKNVDLVERLAAGAEALKFYQDFGLSLEEEALKEKIKNMRASAINNGDYQLAVNLCAQFSFLDCSPQEVNQYRFDDLIINSKKAKNFQEKNRYLLNAREQCISSTLLNCKEEIDRLLKEAHETECNAVLTSLYKGTSFSQQKQRLEEAEKIIKEGYVPATLKEKFNQEMVKIHQKEFYRLTAQAKAQTDYISKVRGFDDAGNMLTSGYFTDAEKEAYRRQVQTVHEEQISALLNQPTNFEQKLQNIEVARDIDRDHLARQFASKIDADYRKAVVREYETRRSRIERLGDQWEEAISIFDNLMEFSSRYGEKSSLPDRFYLEQERTKYLENLYRTENDKVSNNLRKNNLSEAWVRLQNINKIQKSIYFKDPDIPLHENHFQRLYYQYEQELERSKNAKKWEEADRNLNRLKEIQEIAGFVNTDLSPEEHERLLVRSRFDYYLDETERKIDSDRSRAKAYPSLIRAIKDYQLSKITLTPRQVTQMKDLTQLLTRKTQLYLKDSTQPEAYKYGLSEIRELHNLVQLNQEYPEYLSTDQIDSLRAASRKFSKQVFGYWATDAHKELLVDSLLHQVSALKWMIEQNSLLFMRDFRAELRQAFQSIFSLSVEETKDRMKTGDFNYRETINSLEKIYRENPEFIDSLDLKKASTQVVFYAGWMQGDKSIKEQRFLPGLEHLTAAEKVLSSGFISDSIIIRGIYGSMQRGLAGEVAKRLKIIEKISTPEERLDSCRSLIYLRNQFRQVELDADQQADFQKLESELFSEECAQANQESDQSIQKGNEEIKQKSYLKAMENYAQALAIANARPDCQLDFQKIQDLVNKYQPAVEFLQKQEAVKDPLLRENLPELDRQYQDLWQFYTRNDIRRYFDLELKPFEDFIIESRALVLMRYFVLQYCDKREKINEVNKCLQALINDPSLVTTGGLAEITESMVTQIQPGMPDAKYQESFKFFDFDPNSAVKSRYQTFKKTFKNAWKKGAKK